METARNLRITAFSDKGAMRSNNEDNLYVSCWPLINPLSLDSVEVSETVEYTSDWFVAAVFDGMGGADDGELASLCAARFMPSLVEKLGRKDEYTQAELQDILHESKTEIESEIRKEATNEQGQTPGTTCCGFAMKDGWLVPFWIGDSRMYLLRKEKLYLMTKDHTVAQEKIDQGEVSENEAKTLRSWHYITAYIGDERTDFAVDKGFALEPGDKILLCTDGVSDEFTDGQIADYMVQPYEEAKEEMLNKIRESGDDNATALLIEYISEEEQKSAGVKRIERLKENMLNLFTNKLK